MITIYKRVPNASSSPSKKLMINKFPYFAKSGDKRTVTANSITNLINKTFFESDSFHNTSYVALVPICTIEKLSDLPKQFPELFI